MKALEPNDIPRHPIGVVSSRTGLPADLIRAWERRYGAVSPERGDTGRRLYTDRDIEKLRLLRKVVAAGRRISDVAGQALEDLEVLVAEDTGYATPSAPGADATTRESTAVAALLEEALTAIENLDRNGLERALSRAAIMLSAAHLRRDVLVPLLEEIGERWAEGSLRIIHEHLTSTLVRSLLGSMRIGRLHEGAPLLVVTTPAGQLHELGALMAAAAADESGWRVVYLGPNLPAEEIAASARQLSADAVALSILHRNQNLHLREEVVRLRHYLDTRVTLFLGGRAAAGLGAMIGEDGVVVEDDLAEFQAALVRAAHEGRHHTGS